MKAKHPQVYCTAEEGWRDRIRAQAVRLPDRKGMQKRERAGIDFQKLLDVRPSITEEVEISDPAGVGRKHGHCADGNSAIDDYIQMRSLRAFKEGPHVRLAI